MLKCKIFSNQGGLPNSGIYICYAGYIQREDQNLWRSSAAAWRKD